MKFDQLMEEVERTIDDTNERNYVLEGNLGFILSSTQVLFYIRSNRFNYSENP